MAQMFLAGDFVGKGEKLAAQIFEQQLPATWQVICNKELRFPSGVYREVDFIVVGRHSVFTIDEKSWGGVITGNDTSWVSYGEGLGNPLRKANDDAKHVKGHLSRGVPILGEAAKYSHYVHGRVLLTDEDVLFRVSDARAKGNVIRAADCATQLQQFDENAKQEIDLDPYRAAIIRSLRNLPSRPAVPKRIPPYEILRAVKTTGVTRCYVGRHDDNTEKLLKVIERPTTVVDTTFLTAKNLAFREYDALRRAAASGRAPLVESYFPFDQEQFWVVPIEPVPGRSLRADRTVENSGEDRIIAVVNDAFNALREIHELGIIHRGLTPDRIFLADTRVRFTDFFAARIEGKGTIVRSLGELVDLDPYAAPEMLLDPPITTRATDTYSLAASLWYWVTGHELEPLETSEKTAAYRPDLLSAFCGRLDSLFTRCITLDGSTRPQPSEVSI